MGRREGREVVGTQEGPGLVDKLAEDTIDNQEHENLIEEETMINPKEINVKRNSPDLKPPKKLDDKISRLVHGAGVSWS